MRTSDGRKTQTFRYKQVVEPAHGCKQIAELRWKFRFICFVLVSAYVPQCKHTHTHTHTVHANLCRAADEHKCFRDKVRALAPLRCCRCMVQINTHSDLVRGVNRSGSSLLQMHMVPSGLRFFAQCSCYYGSVDLDGCGLGERWVWVSGVMWRCHYQSNICD